MNELSFRLAKGVVASPLEDLLKHAAMMSDSELVRDFEDCLVPVAQSPEDEEALLAYFQARKRAPYFAPGGKTNNHKNIPTEPQRGQGKLDNATCVIDGKRFYRARSTALYCSTRCRKRAERQAAAEIVTLTSP